MKDKEQKKRLSKGEPSKRLVGGVSVLRREAEARLPGLQALLAKEREDLRSIGELVLQARLACDWSRQDLADRTGLSSWWLTLLEQGAVLQDELSDDTLRLLGQAFSQNVSGIFHPAMPLIAIAEAFEHQLANKAKTGENPEAKVSDPTLIHFPTSPMDQSHQHVIRLAADSRKSRAIRPLNAVLYPLMTFTVDGIEYSLQADDEANVLLEPAPQLENILVIFKDKEYELLPDAQRSGWRRVVGLRATDVRSYARQPSKERESHPITFHRIPG